ncbi:MAG: LamG domain-containing protein [Dehalococcoidia bacterium]
MQLRVSRGLGTMLTCVLVVGCAAGKGIERDRAMREERPPVVSRRPDEKPPMVSRPHEQRRPVLYLPFDGSLEEAGPFIFAPRAYGDEVTFGPGVKGQSVFLGGSGDWINVSLDRRVDITKGATLELWVKRDDWINPYRGGSGTQTVATLNVMGINIPAMGYPKWGIEGYVEQWDGKTEKVSALTLVRLRSAAGVIRPHVWNHVALVYDPKSAISRLYLNGHRVDEGNVSMPIQRHSQSLRLGVWSTPANQAYRGYIDELKLYDYPRTADQIFQSSKP